MLKARILLILGIMIALLPYLGFPYFWKDIFTTLVGIIIIGFSYLMYREIKDAEVGDEMFDNFSENKFEGGIEDNFAEKYEE